jgi:hypothetical protein
MFVIDLFYRKVVDRREEGSMNPMAKTIKYTFDWSVQFYLTR